MDIQRRIGADGHEIVETTQSSMRVRLTSTAQVKWSPAEWLARLIDVEVVPFHQQAQTRQVRLGGRQMKHRQALSTATNCNAR